MSAPGGGGDGGGIRRLSSHPISLGGGGDTDGGGLSSPEFVSPRGGGGGDSSEYGSPAEDFMSARSSSCGGSLQGSQNLDRALSAAAAGNVADGEKPEAAFIPPTAQRSHEPELAASADGLRRAGGPAARSADLEAGRYASSSAFAAASGAAGMKDPSYQLDVDVAELQEFTTPRGQRWGWTIVTLLSLQLGWGLWLMPYSFSRLGWGGAAITVPIVACTALYSSRMFTRLKLRVPDAVIFGDIAHAACGTLGRACTYAVVYSLDATRCIVIQLAATQSLAHLAADVSLSLWAYGGVVAGAAFLLVQVQSLPNLTGFLSIGTMACLTALGITIAKVAMAPNPSAQHDVFRFTASDHGGVSFEAVIVAVMSIFFAFGGQFAFVEILTAMRRPSRFPRASCVCLATLVLCYFALGSAGYWSQGRDMASDIIVWSLPPDSAVRAATAALLLQALSQYLVNINVWTHNILTLCACAYYPKEVSDGVVTAADHGRLPWLAATAFVIGYAYAISVAVPFFSELVGLVTSVTYLTVALTLPAIFCLRLLRKSQGWLDTSIQVFLIPASIAVSGLGTYASVHQLIIKLRQHY